MVAPQEINRISTDVRPHSTEPETTRLSPSANSPVDQLGQRSPKLRANQTRFLNTWASQGDHAPDPTPCRKRHRSQSRPGNSNTNSQPAAKPASGSACACRPSLPDAAVKLGHTDARHRLARNGELGVRQTKTPPSVKRETTSRPALNSSDRSAMIELGSAAKRIGIHRVDENCLRRRPMGAATLLNGRTRRHVHNPDANSCSTTFSRSSQPSGGIVAANGWLSCPPSSQ